MREIEITGSAASKFEGGYPQISLKDLVNEDDFTNNGEFVALIERWTLCCQCLFS